MHGDDCAVIFFRQKFICASYYLGELGGGLREDER